MLVAWRYRKRDSLVQSFDPRAWIIFFICFLCSTLCFWDIRYLSFFLLIALISVFTSGIRWNEMASSASEPLTPHKSACSHDYHTNKNSPKSPESF